MDYPIEGIATVAAHSLKKGVTQYRAVDLATGEQLFLKDLGNQTVNIGEFLAIVAAAKYIIEHDFYPRVIYTDSITALTWFTNKKTASRKRMSDLGRAEIFLKIMVSKIDDITVIHWNTSLWGEIPADFGRK